MPRITFECVLCLCLEKASQAPSRSIGDSAICEECANGPVRRLFVDALEHEHHYPPMWGKQELHFETFRDLFDVDFAEAWRKKMKEYATPITARLYCEHRDRASGAVCSGFLAAKGEGFMFCPQCGCLTCRACGLSERNAVTAIYHVCKEPAETNPCQKLQRGLHYQQCPGCEQNIFQADGCNHMICRPPCSSHFCFVCGKKVAAQRSGHWQRGGCPRFGMNIWDDPNMHSDDDAEASDEDDGETLAEHFRDMARVEAMIEIFDHAADAERVESNRVRLTRGVAPASNEDRFRFYGFVSSNLAITRQVMRSRFDVDRVPDMLTEFEQRHLRIEREYLINQDPAASPQTGTVTQLSDLSDEFDVYFVFAIETMADLTIIAEAQRERT